MRIFSRCCGSVFNDQGKNAFLSINIEFSHWILTAEHWDFWLHAT